MAQEEVLELPNLLAYFLAKPPRRGTFGSSLVDLIAICPIGQRKKMAEAYHEGDFRRISTCNLIANKVVKGENESSAVQSVFKELGIREGNEGLLRSETRAVRDAAKESKLPSDVPLAWLGRLPKMASLPPQSATAEQAPMKQLLESKVIVSLETVKLSGDMKQSLNAVTHQPLVTEPDRAFH
eukprot:Skav203090  [mRNA]  locus=scaffold447:157771:158319:+ [translate_table: standard]